MSQTERSFEPKWTVFWAKLDGHYQSGRSESVKLDGPKVSNWKVLKCQTERSKSVKLYRPLLVFWIAQFDPRPSTIDRTLRFCPGTDRDPWLGTGLPGKWMIISGTNAINVQAMICPNPDKSKNCAPTVIVFEMIQTAISQSKRDRAWNANEIRKKRTNFFDRCSDCRDDRDVKWDAISKIGDLRIYS